MIGMTRHWVMLQRFYKIVLFCNLIASLPGQPGPPKGPVYGLIAGSVMDAVAQTPIRKAIVTLTMLVKPIQDAVAWTDDSGHFAFGYLPQARYELRVQSDGYQSATLGADTPGRLPEIITLKAGENRSDFVIRLSHLSSVSGTVTDDRGDPVQGVRVLLQRPGLQRMRNYYGGGPSAVTDVNGHYRISISPGKYSALAQTNNHAVLQGAAEVSAASPPPRQSFYVTQYYPGTENPAAAGVISIADGKEIEGIDFRLISRPAGMLQGSVILPPGSPTPSSVQVRLLESGNRIGWAQASAMPPDYRFIFPNVPEGQHSLVVQAVLDGKRYRTAQSVDVSDESSREINIGLEPGVTIGGTVTVTGPEAEKHPPSFVTLLPGDDLPWDSGPLRATVSPDGTYQIPDVPAGVWDIDAGPVPKGGYMKSMKLGEEDVLTGEMRITSSTPAPLKIVISTNGATISGKVAGAAGDPVRAAVLVMPQGRFGYVVSFRASAASDEKGHYEVLGVRPGTYKLYALERFDFDQIQNPANLKAFAAKAVTIEIQEGEKMSQDLKLIATPAGGN
jgi:hypothetical protein